MHDVKLTVEAQERAEGSTLECCRTALATRRSFVGDAGDDVQLLDAGEHVLAFQRGDLLPLDCAVWVRRAQPPTQEVLVSATGGRC